jgi:hypothetical protein
MNETVRKNASWFFLLGAGVMTATWIAFLAWLLLLAVRLFL